MARIKLSGGQFEAPNTKLMGPVKWSYFYLYVILDIFSRRVTGWRVEHAESAIQFKAPRRAPLFLNQWQTILRFLNQWRTMARSMTPWLNMPCPPIN